MTGLGIVSGITFDWIVKNLSCPMKGDEKILPAIADPVHLCYAFFVPILGAWGQAWHFDI